MANIKSNRGITRVLDKITKSFESGNFYESHQLYKTLYFRYSAQGKLSEILGVFFFLDIRNFPLSFGHDKTPTLSLQSSSTMAPTNFSVTINWRAAPT
jgi:hypothetical protein